MQDINEPRCGFDQQKMQVYNNYLAQYAEGKVICDIGTGPGILAYLALRHGAKKVYVIDKVLSSIEIARLTLEEFSDRVEFIAGDAYEIEYPDDIDIIIHEILGDAVYDENVLPILAQVNKCGLLDKLVPRVFEFFKYNWDADIRPLPEYKAKWFPDEVLDFHIMLEEISPGIITKCTRTMTYSEKGASYKEHLPFYMMMHEAYNIDEWGKLDHSKFKNLEKDEYVGWRAYLTPTLFYDNTPRQGNNWNLISNTYDLRRLYKATEDYTNNIMNRFEEHKCPFFT